MSNSIQRVRDEWLALRCQHGEPEAFAELVREMERPLLYFALKLVRDESTALDVLQEVWLKAFRTMRGLGKPALLRSWLYQLTRSLAIDRLRKEAAQARQDLAHAEAHAEAGAEPTFDTDDAAALHRALDRLDLRHREVLVLHFLEDLPLAEIAAVLGCPEGTVKSRIHHAKRALQAALEGGRHGIET
jgi:RNA polymerase sigma-70 factor (ECF subfamily)